MKVDVKTLISSQDQLITESDLVEKESQKKVGLEPDTKVLLCNPRMADVNGKPHLVCDTKPFKTLADAMYYRVRFNHWRKTNCLKTLDDWHSWHEFYEASVGLQHCKGKVRLKKDEGTEGVLLRMFLRAYAQERLGLKRTMSYAALAKWLTDNGYKTSPSQARGGVNKELYLGLVRKTRKSEALLKVMRHMFPYFEYDQLMAKH